MSVFSSRWKRFVSNDHRFEPGDLEYRHAYLINTILLILWGVMALFALLNVTLAHYPSIALIDACGAGACLWALVYFHRTDNLQVGGALAVAIYLAVVVAFLSITRHHYYAFYWLSLVPPLSLFLLGRRRGLWTLWALFGGMGVFMARGLGVWEPSPFGFEAILNIGAASVALIAMVAYCESSKEETHAALRRQNEILVQLSNTDRLTGLANRQRLDRALIDALLRGLEGSVGLILIDVDRFKAVNDQHGHVAGDAVLMEVAGVLQGLGRPQDTVGRWGGEEFMVVCPGTGLMEAQMLAVLMRERMERHPFASVDRLTISVGVTASGPGSTPDSLMRSVDEALYRAKAGGRNRVEVQVDGAAGG